MKKQALITLACISLLALTGCSTARTAIATARTAINGVLDTADGAITSAEKIKTSVSDGVKDTASAATK